MASRRRNRPVRLIDGPFAGEVRYGVSTAGDGLFNVYGPALDKHSVTAVHQYRRDASHPETALWVRHVEDRPATPLHGTPEF